MTNSFTTQRTGAFIRRMARTAAVGLGLVTVAQCSGPETTGTPSAGRTTVSIADDPFPYDSIARVDLFVVSVEASPSPDTTPSNTDWRMIAQPNRKVNLLSVQGGASTVLGDASLDAGEYRAIRMIIDTDQSGMTDKLSHDVPILWGSSAGKPKLYALVEAPLDVPEEGADIVIDVDVGRSFLYNIDGTKRFHFTPWFRAVNRAATGTISGRVLADTLSANPAGIPNTTITIYRGNPAAPMNTWSVAATGKTTATGDFVIAFLLPGTYILRADAPRGSAYSAGVRTNVVVTAGATTTDARITLPTGGSTGGGGTDSTATGSGAETLHLDAGNPTNLLTGDSTTMHAWVSDSAGRYVGPRPIYWSSSNSAVASWRYVYMGYDSTRMVYVKGASAGTATVTAEYWRPTGSIIKSVTVNVAYAAPVASITISPPSKSIAVGDTVRFTATALDASGNPTPRSIGIYSSDSTVALIYGPNGLFRGMKVGTATITASSGGKTATASLTVH